MTDTNAGPEPMFTAAMYGSAELAQQAHIAFLRERVAELEGLVRRYRQGLVDGVMTECDELDRLRAKNEALSDCLRECADDLEAEVKARGDLPRRVERDLEPVRRARELLAARAARGEG
jgi:hypothetical protein